MDALYRAATSLLFTLMSFLGIQAAPATWQLQTMLDGRTVSLTISDHPHSSHSSTIPIDEFDGLKPLLQTAGPARFRLSRDAGVFEFDGVVRGGSGGGTMEFVASETFAVELAKRGFQRPTRVEQYKLAWHDTGFAFIDELAALKYDRPTLQQLVDAGDHGIDRTYVRDMTAAGVALGTVDALIRQHDHGVNASYVRDLASFGLKRLGADDLIRARDHGISPGYVRDLGSLGYRGVTLADLVRLRDHGVNPAWLRVVKDRNAGTLSIDQLVSLRDHGVETMAELRRSTHSS